MNKFKRLQIYTVCHQVVVIQIETTDIFGNAWIS